MSSFLIYCLLKSVLFNFYILWIFQFSFCCYWFFSFIPLWLEEILCMISIFLNVLRLVLWPNTWPSLENVYVYLRRMYILLFLDEVCICLLGQVSLVLFISSVSLLNFCLDVLFHYWSVMLESPVIVELSIFPFNFVNVCFMYFELLFVYVYSRCIFLMSNPFIQYILTFITCNNFLFKVCFAWY